MEANGTGEQVQNRSEKRTRQMSIPEFKGASDKIHKAFYL